MNINADKIQLTSDVSILIGENGGGKSRILNLISDRYTQHGRNVIAVANCIYDKFDSSLSGKKNFNFIGARFGSDMARLALKETLIEIERSSENRLLISNLLKYIGYDASIGISFEPGNNHTKQMIDGLLKLSGLRHSNSIEFLSRNLHYKYNEIIPIDLLGDDYSLSFNKNYIDILNNEDELIHYEIINKITLYLIKNNIAIPLKNASSGELHQISNFSYIASKIKKHSIILIDEPECSLHPKWQEEYINRLFDSFYHYNPKFIIATHSPLILSSLAPTRERIKTYTSSVYNVTDFNATLLNPTSGNVEGLLWEMFKIITPENRYLSNYIIELMNNLDSGDTTQQDALEKISILKRNSNNIKQQATLDGIKEIILKQDKHLTASRD
ncbi:AAA family ATPase [Plesiomonas shigelloides]|uniref:AAA family ATPase n=1 Tax=Plesiomonas shigelloides TaxID=703 RepID=UPI0015AE8FCB|nr:AAA family ATPase [Plesiomonas shigelloides]